MAAVVGLAVIIVASSFYYRWLLERGLFVRLRDLDDVRSSGLPPTRWVRRGKPPAWDRRTLRRLRGLGRFVRHTRMVENEEVRAQVLDELKRIGEANRPKV